jgi:IS30 family transposase
VLVPLDVDGPRRALGHRVGGVGRGGLGTPTPWRLTNIEVSNGLLRQYLPKGTDLRVHDAVGLAVIETKLNTRPRKILSWKTSAEVFGPAT